MNVWRCCNVLLLAAAQAAGAAEISLNGEWRLDYWAQPETGAVRTLDVPADHGTVKATVPGNCELDLVRAGVLPEPEVGLNVRKFRAYEGHQWLYTRKFAHVHGMVSRSGRAVRACLRRHRHARGRLPQRREDRRDGQHVPPPPL